MDRAEQFFELANKEMTAILATAGKESVTMRTVSPVVFNRKILFFTQPGSVKYEQLKSNPHCSVKIGVFFAECTAEFFGATMNDENQSLREAYDKKFPQAFAEGIEFGGRNAEFVLLTPERLKGWAFENDKPDAYAIPTIPFEVIL